LANLKQLDLSNTKVSDEGAEGLQQALPNCKILRGGDSPFSSTP
jgi:hypothetical protein